MINLIEIYRITPQAFDNPQKLKATLSDLYPNERARIAVLTTILSCGIVDELKQNSLDDLKTIAYCSRLENEYGFAEKYSNECLQAWYIFLQSLKVSKRNAASAKVTDQTQNFHSIDFFDQFGEEPEWDYDKEEREWKNEFIENMWRLEETGFFYSDNDNETYSVYDEHTGKIYDLPYGMSLDEKQYE